MLLNQGKRHASTGWNSMRSPLNEILSATRAWRGLLKEGFTDADNFGVTFPAQWDVKWKAISLGAVFLMDFVHFENRGKD